MTQAQYNIDKERTAVRQQLHAESSFLMKILRGHYLIEQKLNDLLDIAVLYPDVLNASNAPQINFHTKCFLVKALIPEVSIAPWLWPSIHKLNRARNKMAHGLESEKLDASIAIFIKSHRDNDPVYVDLIKRRGALSVEEECEALIEYIYAFLTLYLQKYKLHVAKNESRDFSWTE
ncbi:MAG: hypothetical protein HRU04_18420 [Oceanospirillaceae bacterium]|nr:hypothetical protein [Oceanospirillaceae bacterium]